MNIKQKLFLFNTLTQKKELFKPIDPQNVRMYVCGPTVYDYPHIGNARPSVVFDVLFRVLKYLYNDNVTYVRNITDIDDKIIKKSQENNLPIQEITEKFTKIYQNNMLSLDIISPTLEPKACDHINDMINMIQQLIDLKIAYVSQNHVLFDSTNLTSCKLSNRIVKDFIQTGRVKKLTHKKNSNDFVLWKPSDSSQPSWSSPWGLGRPGWHIECSAMSLKYLGDTFDIHGGGSDLIFPHHENEIAQSTSIHGNKSYAQYWIHNGHVTIEGAKMSKSLGNFVSVEELLQKHQGEVLRFLLLQTQYRKPLDWTYIGLQKAKQSLDKLYRLIWSLQQQGISLNKSENNIDNDFILALLDDLNTSQAISCIHKIARQISKENNNENKQILLNKLIASANIIGILQKDPAIWFNDKSLFSTNLNDKNQTKHSLGKEEIEQLIIDRNQARANKDYTKSDNIREILRKHNIVIQDNPNSSTTWYYDN